MPLYVDVINAFVCLVVVVFWYALTKHSHTRVSMPLYVDIIPVTCPSTKWQKPKDTPIQHHIWCLHHFYVKKNYKITITQRHFLYKVGIMKTRNLMLYLSLTSNLMLKFHVSFIVLRVWVYKYLAFLIVSTFKLDFIYFELIWLFNCILDVIIVSQNIQEFKYFLVMDHLWEIFWHIRT